MAVFAVITSWIINIAMYVATYILTALALYPIAKRNGVKNAWLAFVPVAQYYIIGDICEDYKIFGKWISKLGLVFCGIIIIRFIMNYGMVAYIIDLAAMFAMLLIIHKFFSLFVPEKALIYTIISALGMFAMSIVLYIIRNKPMQMSAGAYFHPFGEKR